MTSPAERDDAAQADAAADAESSHDSSTPADASISMDAACGAACDAGVRSDGAPPACGNRDACVDASSSGCEGGICTLGKCTPGATRCTQGSLQTCSAAGDGWFTTVCTGRSSCVEAAGAASCQPWVCTPSAKQCVNDAVLGTCSADGMRFTQMQDCPSTTPQCRVDACSDMPCGPEETFCRGLEVRKCVGSKTSMLWKTCAPDEYCNLSALGRLCRPQRCAPNANTCQGDSVVNCDALGSGVVDAGSPQDCALQGKACVGGRCDACAPGVAAKSLRIMELHIGDAAYLLIKNTHANCAAEISQLSLRVRSQTANGLEEHQTHFGTGEIAPGETVLLSQTSLQADVRATTRAYADDRLSFARWSGSTVELCLGDCTGADRVIDALAYAGNMQPSPPALPAPLTFTSPPAAFADWKQWNAESLLRVATAGAPPTFLGSDYQRGPATRPSDACAMDRPLWTSDGSLLSYCNTPGLRCTFAATRGVAADTCECKQQTLATGTNDNFWTCTIPFTFAALFMPP